MSIWQSKDKSFIEKAMYLLGWSRRDITRHLTCAWCGVEFEWTGEAHGGIPNYCKPTHKTKAAHARAARIASANPPPKRKPITPAPAPKQPPKPAPRVCTCTNHMGGRKQKYPTKDAAIVQLIRRHLPHGAHRIYHCPDADVWHITSQK